MPPVAVHVTPAFELPVTVAVNCCVPPTCTEAADKFRETDTPLGLGELLDLPLTIPEQPHASTKHGSNAITVAAIPANLFARSDTQAPHFKYLGQMPSIRPAPWPQHLLTSAPEKQVSTGLSALGQS